MRGKRWVCAKASSKSELAGKLADVRTDVCACTRVSRRRVREKAEGVYETQIGTDGADGVKEMKIINKKQKIKYAQKIKKYRKIAKNRK